MGHAKPISDPKIKQMDEQLADTSEDIAARSLRYTKEQFQQALEQTEDYVRENPTRAVLCAVVAGLVIDRLPDLLPLSIPLLTAMLLLLLPIDR